jgi:hypothetical protein
VPALVSCGFDYATDRYYTPGVGANERSGSVDVLAGVIVSSEPGSGTFIASFSNNSTQDATTFDGLAGEVSAASFQPIDIPAGGLVNLADPPAEIKVEGDFGTGDFVAVAVTFGTGEEISLDVPVVPNSDEYAGLDGPATRADMGTETSDSGTEDSGH